MADGFIGFVCGLKSEALALADQDADPAIQIRISGANAARARERARALVEEGAKALISFGVSGGLVSQLKPGDLILGRDVIAGGHRFEAYPSLLRDLETRAAREDIPVTVGTLVGSDVLVEGPAAKADLARHYRALAVDMESHAVAEMAAEADLPFLAIRAIADPHDRSLPKSAAGAVAPDGSIRTLNVLGAAVRRPTDFFTLIKVGQDSAKAHEALRRGARHFVPALLGIMHVG